MFILKEHNAVQGQIIDVFVFAVRRDIAGQGIGSFQAVGHFVTDPASEECLPIMVKCNILVSEWIIWFKDGDFNVIFCHLRHDTMDEVVFN